MMMLTVAGQQVEYRDREDLKKKLAKLFAEFQMESEEAKAKSVNLELRAFMVRTYLRTLPGAEDEIGGRHD